VDLDVRGWSALASFFGGAYPADPEAVWAPEDFVPGTDVPLSRGRVTSATADAFEASFERLVFRFPFDVIALDAPLRAVDVQRSPGRRRLERHACAV
jgi:hypothetical protein